MTQKDCRGILIRGVNWIGDAVMTMPAIRALRKSLPERKLSLLVKPWVAGLFEHDPNIDEIIQYKNEHRGLIGRLRLSLELRKRGFSAAILLQNAFDAAFIAYLSGIPERIGYERDGRGFLLTEPIPLKEGSKSIHHIHYYLDLLRSIGIKAEYSEPWIYLTLEERLDARKNLNELKRPVLGINPGAAYGSSKRWQAGRFAGIAERFVSETGGSAVIFGSQKEVKIADEIISQCIKTIPEHSILSTAGKTSLRGLIALISECDALLTNDSGPMHIGCAVRTPLVAIFGSTDPFLTGPVGRGNKTIKKDFKCSPCFERECKLGSLMCMDAVTVDEVYNTLKGLIPNKRAVFFDRDGTLCRDAHFLNRWEDFEVFSEISSLQKLKEKGFLLIGVSNQSGIARGLVDEGFAKEVNRHFVDKHGFEDFYYCPHHPVDYCACRKPSPGMPLRARVEHGINLKASYVVGDKEDDMLLGRAIGSRTVLVTTGKAKESVNADSIAQGLNQAVEWILKTM